MFDSSGYRLIELVRNLFFASIQTVITNAPIFIAVLAVMFVLAIVMYLITTIMKGKN